MPCTHKFFGHPQHLTLENGLLPNWDIKTLIIGTFNPENLWHNTNQAEYFYGRTRNLFWNALPPFACEEAIPHNDVESQIKFLKRNKIGLTDLLIRIDDADINDEEHVRRVRTVLDIELELFQNFMWNTPQIIDYVQNNDVKAVYFTKLGCPNRVNVSPDSFESQMRIIEQAGIATHRLHTPSGQGLGSGTPRLNNLIQRWYLQNGGDAFPFLCPEFDIEDFPVQYPA